jgi:hypothetical protein
VTRAELVRLLRAGITLGIAFLVALLIGALPGKVLTWLGVLALLALLIWVLVLLLGVRRSVPRENPCADIPERFWRRPDPYIYDQSYLASLGIAITWDNPDIWFERGGARISDNLDPATDYEIVAAVHNGSVEAPAFNTIVEFYSRDYGAGATPVYLGAANLPVVPVQGLGPGFARFGWTTPPGGGHFCILVRLIAVDDTNLLNNEGQKNVRVVHPTAGSATLTLPLFNTGRDALRLSVRPSAYALVASETLDDIPSEPTGRQQSGLFERLRSSPREIEALRDADVRPLLSNLQRAVIEANPNDGFPVSREWVLDLPREEIVVAPGESRTASVSVTLPPSAASGTYPVTLNAYRDDGTLFGGVTELVRVPGPSQTMMLTTSGSPGVVYKGAPQGGGTVPGHRGDIHRTNCVLPSQRDRRFGAGQGAALERAAIWLVLGLLAQALLGGATGTALDIILALVGVNSFVDWWLNRRLLCLGDACAIGIVWSVEPPGDKHLLSFDRFDDDYSVNLLLSPASPGDRLRSLPQPGDPPSPPNPPNPLSIQAHLVEPHAAIVAEGLPTFGVDRVATLANSEGQPGQTVVSRALQDDPPDDEVKNQLGQGHSSWLAFGKGGILPKDAPALWDGQDDGDTRATELLHELPDTQLIHCEFEGTAISNIQPVLIVAGALAGMTIVSNSAAIAAGGVAAIAAAAAWFFLLLFLLAVFTYLVAGHGDPEDAGLAAADINTIANDKGQTPTTGAWDDHFTLVAIRGRFVYDYGHSRGWNEIHPAKTISKITDDAFERQLAEHKLPSMRPRTKAEVDDKILNYCDDVWPATNTKPRTIAAVHPALVGSHLQIVG